MRMLESDHWVREKPCPSGRTRRRSAIGRRSCGSSGRCRMPSRLSFYRARSAARSCRRRRGLRSTRTGARIPFAPIGAGAGAPQRSACRLDMAHFGQSPQRIAGDVPLASGALSRARFFSRPRFLLRMRAEGLSLRLACRSVGCGPEQERQLALRLRDRMAILECAERGSASSSPPAGAPVCRERRAVVEECRDRSPRAAVSGMERMPRHAVAGAPRLLGAAQPAGDQPRGACRQMRHRGARAARGEGSQ
jgi:hypothetical protein